MRIDRAAETRSQATVDTCGGFAGASPVAKYSVAIIGGAGVGVSVFHALVTSIAQTPRPEDFKIAIYEKSGQFGTGVAYGTTLPGHLLNMRSATMSALSEQQNHFVEWLLRTQAKGNGVRHIRAADFPPRMVFAQYLHDLFRETMAMADELGIEVSLLPEDAIGLSVNPDESLSIETANDVQTYESAILCLGNQPPPIIKQLRGAPGYFPHAWPETRLMREVPRDADVIVLGTGLTAIDTFITLQEGDHTGEVILASRHGLLPKVRSFPHPLVLSHLSPKNVVPPEGRGAGTLGVEELAARLLRELVDAGARYEIDGSARLAKSIDILCRRAPLVFKLHQAHLMAQPAATVLRQDIERSEDRFQRIFSVLKAVDEVVGRLWNALSLDAQRAFDRDFRSLWNAYDYPMPRQNAKRVLAALDSGQLSVRRTAGRAEHEVSYDSSSRRFFLRLLDGAGRPEVVTAKCLIDATGQGLDIRGARQALISSAVRQGLIVPHDRGGIDVDFETGSVRNAKGSINRRLFVVGSLTRGVHFYTNSMNENAKCGKRAVLAVMEHYWDRQSMDSDRRRSA